MKKLFIVFSIIFITQSLTFAYQNNNDFNSITQRNNQSYSRFSNNDNGFNNYQKYIYDRQYNDFNYRQNSANQNLQHYNNYYNNFNNRNYYSY